MTDLGGGERNWRALLIRALQDVRERGEKVIWNEDAQAVNLDKEI